MFVVTPSPFFQSLKYSFVFFSTVKAILNIFKPMCLRLQKYLVSSIQYLGIALVLLSFYDKNMPSA